MATPPPYTPDPDRYAGFESGTVSGTGSAAAGAAAWTCR